MFFSQTLYVISNKQNFKMNIVQSNSVAMRKVSTRAIVFAFVLYCELMITNSQFNNPPSSNNATGYEKYIPEACCEIYSSLNSFSIVNRFFGGLVICIFLYNHNNGYIFALPVILSLYLYVYTSYGLTIYNNGDLIANDSKCYNILYEYDNVSMTCYFIHSWVITLFALILLIYLIPILHWFFFSRKNNEIIASPPSYTSQQPLPSYSEV